MKYVIWGLVTFLAIIAIMLFFASRTTMSEQQYHQMRAEQHREGAVSHGIGSALNFGAAVVHGYRARQERKAAEQAEREGK